MAKPKSPLWMAVYVARFLGETAHMSCEQLGAYVRLILTMWLQGGTLPNDATALRRIAHVHSPRWRSVWHAIESMFHVDETVTNDTVNEELTKARVIIETRRAAGALGGETTRERYSRRGGYGEAMRAPKPLKVIRGGAANAPDNHNHNREIRKEEREDATRPETVASPREEKEASKGEVVESPFPTSHLACWLYPESTC